LVDDRSDPESDQLLWPVVHRLHPPPDASVAEICECARALGWIDPRLVDNLVTDHDQGASTYRLVVASALVGLAGRLADVVVMELVDDPHGRDPVHQMLGARLADQLAMTAAIDATIDRLSPSTEHTAAAAATLALAYEVAVSACDAATLAASSDETLEQIADRRAWLAAIVRDASPLRLLDEVAGDLEMNFVT
jgi:hypothetical protein